MVLLIHYTAGLCAGPLYALQRRSQQLEVRGLTLLALSAWGEDSVMMTAWPVLLEAKPYRVAVGLFSLQVTSASTS